MIPTLVMADGNEEPPPSDHVLLLAGLPEGLHVEAALLATRWEIAGTPGQCELVLPKAPPTENTSGFSRRPLSAPDVPGAERAFAWWTQHIDGAEWGKDWHHGARGESTTAYLKNALILTKYLPPDDGDYRGPFTRDTGATATAWLNALAEWLEMLCGVDLQPNQPHGPRVGLAYLHNVALGTTHSADRIAAFGYTEPIAHQWTEPTAVTRSEWAMAVTLTNDAAARPDAHLFLRDARAALHRESERRAVVDACTAVEVALAESIARIHPQAASQPAEVRRAIGTAGGLVRLFDLHQAIAPIQNVSRSQVMDRLAGPRNETAHAGAAVTHDHARQALELATTIVHSTSPLPRGVQPRRVVGYVSATGTVSAVE